MSQQMLDVACRVTADLHLKNMDLKEALRDALAELVQTKEVAEKLCHEKNARIVALEETLRECADLISAGKYQSAMQKAARALNDAPR